MAATRVTTGAELEQIAYEQRDALLTSLAASNRVDISLLAVNVVLVLVVAIPALWAMVVGTNELEAYLLFAAPVLGLLAIGDVHAGDFARVGGWFVIATLLVIVASSTLAFLDETAPDPSLFPSAAVAAGLTLLLFVYCSPRVGSTSATRSLEEGLRKVATAVAIRDKLKNARSPEQRAADQNVQNAMRAAVLGINVNGMTEGDRDDILAKINGLTSSTVEDLQVRLLGSSKEGRRFASRFVEAGTARALREDAYYKALVDSKPDPQASAKTQQRTEEEQREYLRVAALVGPYRSFLLGQVWPLAGSIAKQSATGGGLKLKRREIANVLRMNLETMFNQNTLVAAQAMDMSIGSGEDAVTELKKVMGYAAGLAIESAEQSAAVVAYGSAQIEALEPQMEALKEKFMEDNKALLDNQTPSIADGEALDKALADLQTKTEELVETAVRRVDSDEFVRTRFPLAVTPDKLNAYATAGMNGLARGDITVPKTSQTTARVNLLSAGGDDYITKLAEAVESIPIDKLRTFATNSILDYSGRLGNEIEQKQRRLLAQQVKRAYDDLASAAGLPEISEGNRLHFEDLFDAAVGSARADQFVTAPESLDNPSIVAVLAAAQAIVNSPNPKQQKVDITANYAPSADEKRDLEVLQRDTIPERVFYLITGRRGERKREKARAKKNVERTRAGIQADRMQRLDEFRRTVKGMNRDEVESKFGEKAAEAFTLLKENDQLNPRRVWFPRGERFVGKPIYDADPKTVERFGLEEAGDAGIEPSTVDPNRENDRSGQYYLR